jgi:tetratricopeptide (TPR) repeat protein
MKKIILIFTSFLIFVPQTAYSHNETHTKMWVQALKATRLIFEAKFDKGGQTYARAMQFKKSSQLYTLLLLSLELNKKHRSALLLCKRIPKEAESEHTLMYWCGRFLWNYGIKKPAIKFVSRAISLGGNLPHYLSTMAIMQWKAGKKKLGEAYFKKLILKDPWVMYSYLYPDYLTGIILTMNDLFANYKFKKKFLHSMSYLAYRSKHPDLANKFLKKSWKLFTIFPPSAYFLKLNIIKSLGDEKLNKKILATSLKKSPNDFVLKDMQVKNLIAKGKLYRARRILNKLIKHYPNSVVFLTKLGTVNLELGNISKAKKFFEYAKSRKGTSSELYYGLGRLYQKQRKYVDAYKVLKIARDSDPTNPKYQSAYIALLKSLNKKDELKVQMKRLKNITKVSKELELLKINYSKWYKQATKLKSVLVTGQLPKFPVNCDFQCKVFKEYYKLSKGKKGNLKQILNKFNNLNILKSKNPLNVWIKSVQLEKGKKGMLINHFYSIPPIYFK